MKNLFSVILAIITAFYSSASISKEKTSHSLNLNKFDITIEILPANYKGTDISVLYSSLLKKIPINKNEFESTNDYENKVAELMPDNTFAFKLIPSYYEGGLNISPYNADSEKFLITIKTEALSHNTFSDYRPSLIVQTMNKNSSALIGSNAYGATRNMTRYEATQYGLAFTNAAKFGIKMFN